MMTLLLDHMEALGLWSLRALWLPLLAWTLLALPAAWLLDRRTLPLSALMRYRAQQSLLWMLPVGFGVVWFVSTVLPALWPMPVRPVVLLPGISVGLDALTVTAHDTGPGLTVWHAVGAATSLTLLAAAAGLTRVALRAVAVVRARRAVQQASVRDPLSPRLQRVLDEQTATLSLRRPVEAIVTRCYAVPMLLPGRVPCVVIPHALVHHSNGAAHDELRMALTHELIHARRYDDLALWAEHLIVALALVHPGVKWLQRAIARARERACDAEVLAGHTFSPRHYATLLLRVGTTPALHRGALSLSEGYQSLNDRITAMNDTTIPSRLSRYLSHLAIALILVVLPASMIACSDVGAPSETAEVSPSEASGTSAKDDGETYVVVEDQPELIGGMSSVIEKLSYPETAAEAGLEGRVLVQFVVDTDGNVEDPEIKRGVHELLDQEALRVVKELRFEPGEHDGKPVRVRMSLPITFKLPAS